MDDATGEDAAPLAHDEVRALIEPTPIIVTWSGGNGPHPYTLITDPEGRQYAAPRGDEHGRLRYCNPLEFVGQERFHTQVWVDDFGGTRAVGDTEPEGAR